jgi:AcrR family transcriptional regulator
MNMAIDTRAGHQTGKGERAEEFSARQREVLDAVLALMVEEGDGFSMAAVCRRASCSKETLYNWFGDRDGLLTATVQWQASKVRMPVLPGEGLSRTALERALAGFAANWLAVLTGDLSIALNRAAVSHAGQGTGAGKSRLGEIVLTNGPDAMRRRLEPLFIAGRDAGLLDFEDAAEPFRAFFGLAIGDTQIRVLLGGAVRLTEAGREQRAALAAKQFLALYGT